MNIVEVCISLFSIFCWWAQVPFLEDRLLTCSLISNHLFFVFWTNSISCYSA